MQNSIFWIALAAAVALVLFAFLRSSAPPSGHSAAVLVEPHTAPDSVLELPSGSLASAALSEDGRRLAVARNFVSEQEGRASTMTELRLFDLEAGQALWTVSYANPNCCGLPIVQMTPDSQFILGAGKQLHLYAQDGQELRTFSYSGDDEFTLLSAAISADGRLIAATSAYRAYLFSSEGEHLLSMKFPEVPAVALSRDGQYLLVTTHKLFQVYRTEDRTIVRQGELPYQDVVTTPAIAEDGSVFAVAGSVGRDDLTVFIFRQDNIQQIVLGAVNAPQLSLERRWLRVEGTLGGEAALIDLTDGSLRRFPKQSASVHIALWGERLGIGREEAIELRRLSDDQVLWQAQAPGTVLALWLRANRVIALGNDQVWTWKVQG